MARSLLLISLYTACLSYCDLSAAAEQLDTSGTVALGVDRVFGVVNYSESYNTPNSSGVGMDANTYHDTNWAILGRATAAFMYMQLQSPRLSADVIVVSGISLGGGIVYDYDSGKSALPSGNGTDSHAGIWVLAPRIGFAKMLTKHVGLWPHAGITYMHYSEDYKFSDTNSVTTSTGDSAFLTLDANFVLSPISHTGLTIGPTLDLLIHRHNSPDSTSKDDRLTAIGVQAGLLIWI